ncbi:MAG: hypothetical protein Q8R00_04645 [Candidatus Nanoarchaeia archaeon]|nr:hypothetical protein [Candidatus Nanoarchaeia archaeon]
MPGQKDKLLNGFKLKQDHIFNLGDMYKMLFRWFENHGYKFSEKEYRYHGQGDHVEIVWHAEKDLDNYTKIELDINFLLIGLQKVDIEQEGVKTKSNKGSIEIIFDMVLIRDPKDKFSPMIRNIYEKFIIKNRIILLQTEAGEEATELINEIKSFLQLHKLN